jgi:hypothetical protein
MEVINNNGLGAITYCTRGGSDAEDMPHWSSVEGRVKAYHYPFCCTGAVLTGLGGSSTAYGGADTLEAEELRGELTAWVVAFKVGYLSNSRKQFISACTTCRQGVANRVLEELGFIPSAPVKNSKYGGVLYTWMLELHPEEEE